MAAKFYTSSRPFFAWLNHRRNRLSPLYFPTPLLSRKRPPTGRKNGIGKS
ncbi:hypothetical protein [uncultured Hymenobacter sp.]